MRTFVPFACAFALAISSSAAFSQATINTDVNVRGGATINAPGQRIQQKGSVKGTTGASGYAPGQQMRTKGSVKGTTGASGYAPGRTKSDTNIDADVKTRSR